MNENKFLIFWNNKQLNCFPIYIFWSVRENYKCGGGGVNTVLQGKLNVHHLPTWAARSLVFNMFAFLQMTAFATCTNQLSDISFCNLHGLKAISIKKWRHCQLARNDTASFLSTLYLCVDWHFWNSVSFFFPLFAFFHRAEKQKPFLSVSFIKL